MVRSLTFLWAFSPEWGQTWNAVKDLSVSSCFSCHVGPSEGSVLPSKAALMFVSAHWLASPRSCAWYPIPTIEDQHPNLFSQGRIKQACLLTINACPVICWPFSLVYWELQSYHWMLTGHSWDAGPDMLDDTLEIQPSGLASQSSEPSYCGHCGQGRKEASGLKRRAWALEKQLAYF